MKTLAIALVALSIFTISFILFQKPKSEINIDEQMLNLKNLSGKRISILHNGKELITLNSGENANVGKKSSMLGPGDILSVKDDILPDYKINATDNRIVFGDVSWSTEGSEMTSGWGIDGTLSSLTFRNFSKSKYRITYFDDYLGDLEPRSKKVIRPHSGFRVNTFIHIQDSDGKDLISLPIDHKHTTHINVGVVKGYKRLN